MHCYAFFIIRLGQDNKNMLILNTYVHIFKVTFNQESLQYVP